MVNVGIIGSRGMVGSTLIKRMREQQDFNDFHSTLFSYTHFGKPAPKLKNIDPTIQHSENWKALLSCKILLSCQGSSYSKIVYPQLISKGWQGYWIDASSLFRMDNDAIIVLDVINKQQIESGIKRGIKKFIGGNCTVSLMAMALYGLLDAHLIEWIHSSTYQAISGAGAKNMQALLKQMHKIHHLFPTIKDIDTSPILETDNAISQVQKKADFSSPPSSIPLAYNLNAWIDSDSGDGISKEEKKMDWELNKILNFNPNIPVTCTAIRVNVLRCHSQSILMKLKKNISPEEVGNLLMKKNPWVDIIPNKKEESIQHLSPIAINQSLRIAVGRIKKLESIPQVYSLFTVGDQLLWGAAEPLRRVLKIILSKII